MSQELNITINKPTSEDAQNIVDYFNQVRKIFHADLLKSLNKTTP